MSNLLITLIAIIIVVILSLVGLYFGGNSMSDGSATSEAARYSNEATQIAAAIQMYRAAGNEIGEGFELSQLVPQYLQAMPVGDWVVVDGRLYRQDVNELSCFKANEIAGFKYSSSDTDVVAIDVDPNKFVPLCTKPELSPNVACCVNP